MKLEERALLVKLTLGQWSAKKTDREATRETIANKHAQQGTGFFMKRLLGRNAMKQISKVLNDARHTHNIMTLPWTDDGCRIITTEAYDAYAKAMKESRMSLRDAVSDFLKDYDKLKQEAKVELGDLFNPEDYPSKEEVNSKFYMDVEPRPVPISRDFRAKVSNAEAKIIAKDIEERMNERLKEATNDVWERIITLTERMHEKLSNYDPGTPFKEATGIFHRTLVDNVRELADVLPSLNLTGDKRLDEIHKKLKADLCAFDVEELRSDDQKRIATAKKAKAISSKVSQYML